MRIELDQVGKRFGRVLALDGITLDVPSGARVALVGPNGSGKTTLTRAIMGVLACDGQVRLDGLDAFAERVRLAHRLAYVPQVAPQMAASVGEIVRTVAAVRGLLPARTAELAAQLDLDLGALAARPFRGLSGGMKQKLLLALAFASRASLFVLDEPTASLDADARTRFFQLYDRQATGATLLLCSHRLEEIRHLVDHVIALEDGRIAYQGPANPYLAARSGAVVELELAPDATAWARARGFVPGMGGWWRRHVSAAEKVGLIADATQVLGPRLLDVCVRDVDRVEVDRAA